MLLVVLCVSYRNCGLSMTASRNCVGRWLLHTDPLVISLLLAETRFRKPDGQLLHTIALRVDATAIFGMHTKRQQRQPTFDFFPSQL